MFPPSVMWRPRAMSSGAGPWSAPPNPITRSAGDPGAVSSTLTSPEAKILVATPPEVQPADPDFVSVLPDAVAPATLVQDTLSTLPQEPVSVTRSRPPLG